MTFSQIDAILVRRCKIPISLLSFGESKCLRCVVGLRGAFFFFFLSFYYFFLRSVLNFVAQSKHASARIDGEKVRGLTQRCGPDFRKRFRLRPLPRRRAVITFKLSLIVVTWTVKRTTI